MKTRKQELKDLYYAIKQSLSKRVSSEKAMVRATNMVCRVEQDKSMTIKDIQAMRDTYLKDEKLERPKKIRQCEGYIKHTDNGMVIIMIRTCKQLEAALNEVNDIKLRVEKACGMYRISYGGYRLSCYTLKDLVKEVNKKTVALNYALWVKDESKKTIHIKGLSLIN